MKVIMLKTKKYSPNGVDIVECLKDNIYDLPDKISTIFKKEKWCKIIEDTKEVVKEIRKEVKNIDIKKEKVVENKGIKNSPENKKAGD